MIDRRSFLASAIAGGLIPANGIYGASKKIEPRVSLKKNVVLLSLDLGLYAPNFRDNGARCKYMTEIFSEFKGQMTYFDSISEPHMGGGHSCQPATFTTISYKNRQHYPERKMISLDQILADGSIQETRHKYIYHTINPGSTMSWNRFEQPLPAVEGANNLYETLFARTDARLVKARIRRERDILATLARNLRRYWVGNPQEVDMRASLDYQLAILDEREKWLKVKQPYLKKSFGEKEELKPIPSCHNNFDLIYDALEKQQTKIALVEFGAGRLNQGLSGVELGHHGNTHHGGYPERIYGLETIDRGVLNGVKYFLHKLQEGGLYDDTIVLFHCGMGYATYHTNKKAPALLFGGGFNHKESVQCLKGPKEHRYGTANLFSSILKHAGFKDWTFQTQNKLIDELFEA